MNTLGAGTGGGLTFADLHRSVARDRYSDFLPLVAWVEEEEAFLCIDDGWGYAWELTPAAYMFAHVHQALLGLFNIQFPENSVLQLITFADPLVAQARDEYLDLKARPDPLIQASARRAHAYLNEGRNGLGALHGIPVRNFRTFLAVKTRTPMHSDLKRQVEEQLAKLGIRRVAPHEMVAFYRRIFNGVFEAAPGVFASGAPGHPSLPIRKQIVDAGPDLAFDGAEVFLGGQVARCLTPKAPARRVTAERTNRLIGGMRGSSEDSDQIGGPFLYCLNVLFDHSQFEIHKRAQILSAQKAAGSFAVEVGKQIAVDGAGRILPQSDTLGCEPALWPLSRAAHDQDARARFPHAGEGRSADGADPDRFSRRRAPCPPLYGSQGAAHHARSLRSAHQQL